MTFRGTWEAYGATGKPCLDRSPNCAGMLCKARAKALSKALTSFPVDFGRLLLAVVVIGFAPGGLMAQSHSSPPPAPHSAAPHPSSAPHPSGSHPPSNQHHPPGQQHLGEWMQKNQGLTPDEQVKKLQQEQGFNKLTPQQQQNATNRLRQLNQMPPDQRQRVLDRVENMEHLSPQQQEQVRGSARQLGQMPPDRQQAVKDAIRNLRNVPPGLRQSELNSKYGNQLSPEERGVVGNLLSVESYHPPPPPPR
jgi:hypothetical protein